jgi:hypothetical protein
MLAALLAAYCDNPGCAESALVAGIGTPLLTIGQILLPGMIGIVNLHRLMEHQESGGAFVVNMVVKAGGAILIFQLVKSIVVGL